MPPSKLKDQIYSFRPVRRLTQSFLLRNTPDSVFVWIPKTAGTSLFYWLRDNIGMCKMNVPRDFTAFPGYGAATFGHVHYLSLLYMGIVPAAFHERAFKFALVRDPYRRIASLYNYLRVDQGYTKEFPAFIADVRLRRPPVGLYNHRGLSQTNPQVDWLMHWDGSLITDAIYPVERMDEAIAALAAKFSIAAPPPLESRNISQKFISASDLDREAIEQINEIYARDFELLGYPKR